MIPALKTVDIETNIDDADSFEFTMDADAMAHLMSVLTNIYSDPMLAVIREYIINGIDSHVEAGNPAPVEVSSPGALDATFRVRDYGVGLNVNDMRNIYSKYGASTKRDTNDQTGMLGIGSKSALTITNQFTVTGYKDGMRTVGIVSLNERGVPEFLIMDTSTTDEPNGVLIEVPVSNVREFNNKLNEFARFVEPGKMTLDGKILGGHGLERLADNLYWENISAWSDHPSISIIMGNVKYTTSIAPPFGLRKKFYWRVPIGSVQIAPSRESIIASSDFSSKAQEVVSKAIAEKIKKTFDTTINTHEEAVSLYRENSWLWNIYRSHRSAIVSHTGPLDEPTWKGYPLFTTASSPIMVATDDRFGWSLSIYTDTSLSEKAYSLNNPLNITGSMLIVTGLPEDKRASRPSTGLRNKMRKYMQDAGIFNGNADVLLLNKDIDHPWLSHVKRATLEDIAKIKVPRATTTASNGPAPFEVYIPQPGGGIRREDVLDFKPFKNIVYGSLTQFGMRSNDSNYKRLDFGSLAKNFGVDAFVICPNNRVSRLERIAPGAKSIYRFTVETAQAISKEAVQVKRWSSVLAKNLDRMAVEVDRVLDPSLRSVVQSYSTSNQDRQRDAKLRARMDSLKSSMTYLRGEIGVGNHIFEVSDGELIQDVPGYQALSRYVFAGNEALLYANAVYLDKKEKK